VKRATAYRESMDARPKVVRITAREKVLAVRDALSARLGRLPTAREIAEGYGCHPTRVRELLAKSEFGSGPKRWARVPKDAWEMTMDKLRRIDKVLAKHGIADVVELDRKLAGGDR
jgi:DNA-directed RNA polymerase specialized sigma subunit